ncbi:MAG: hypothetical protein ACO1NW_13000 [Chitinophagaceae bacterium]
MLALTGLSVYNGQATVFYIIYLFWWNELIVKVAGKIFNRLSSPATKRQTAPASASSAPLMLIYWILIVVIFGFVTGLEDQSAMQTNLAVLFFRNTYFNMNIVFMVITAFLHKVQNSNLVADERAPEITGNMIVLHISIILGAFIFFMVVRGFPETFAPANRWSAVLVIAPFLLLRFLMHWLQRRNAGAL